MARVQASAPAGAELPDVAHINHAAEPIQSWIAEGYPPDCRVIPRYQDRKSCIRHLAGVLGGSTDAPFNLAVS
jgi:hypothetical protein